MLLKLSTKLFNTLKPWDKIKNITYYKDRSDYVYWLKRCLDDVIIYDNYINKEKFILLTPTNYNGTNIDILFKNNIITINSVYHFRYVPKYRLFNHYIIGNEAIIRDFFKYLYNNYPEITNRISLTITLNGYKALKYK